MIIPNRGGSWKLSDAEVQEKASTDTELFIQEVTPTEVIQDQEGSEKASDEVSTVGAKKGTASEEVPIVSTAEVSLSTAGGTVTIYKEGAGKGQDTDYEHGSGKAKLLKCLLKKMMSAEKLKKMILSNRLVVDRFYRLVIVKEKYSASRLEGFDLMLWGDLYTLFESDEEDEIWKSQHEYNLISWRLCDFCGIHILLMENGLAIHMLTEKKYPLSQEMISKMLSRKLEVDHESSQAFELLRFIRSQVQK
ncbi:hypothetical protein Tco_1145133 [Tanacetum coccineum]